MNQPDSTTAPTQTTNTIDALRSLPSLEDTEIQVQTAMDEISTSVSELVPAATWETPHEGSGEDCQRPPYKNANARGYFLPHKVAVRVPVSEQQWAEIQQTAESAAAQLNATDVQVMQNEPGNHDVGFYGPTGLFIKVAYKGNLVVSGYTGCRLPRDSSS
ncbi:LppA family lipoprotein [Mycobacterium sp. M1]|uniref:LppA family lipoprotein n=1 Tax=Mycolicibacter acidiphilus TaxID=2835306 RepID=A0ABS5RL95_9MYCO|nr:LppA family lipoprotein [Mycolicibacter acidiphilus]MBS9534762.1 LppA family lipoprotein [Mycolicibacter acidiphilus]